MSMDLMTSAVLLSILLAPVTVPVCTYALYIVCLRFRPEPGEELMPQPPLEVALIYGAMMAILPISGVGICVATSELLRSMQIYHAPPLAIVATGSLAIFGAGICHATVLTAIVPVSCHQAVLIQERIVGLPVAIFVPFWGACLL